MKLPIGPVMLGPAQAFRGEERSAIFKVPAEGPVAVTALGFAGDEQADRTAHGGPDKAVHHYPHDHYAAWVEELGQHPLLAAPGAFGENITTTGMIEEQVRIGDRFRLGSALVEVSHGRTPCWKIDHKFQHKGVTARVVKTGRCGWYYRVIEEGEVREGDSLELIEQGPAEWTISHVFRLLVGGEHARDRAAVRELARMAVLASAWRDRAAKLST